MVATSSRNSGIGTPDTGPDTSPLKAKVEENHRCEQRSESRTECSCVRRIDVVIDVAVGGAVHPAPDRT